MKTKGMLTLDELARLVESDDIDTVTVVFTDLYGRFMGKRFDAEFFVEDAVKAGAHGCNYLLTVDMEMEPVPGYTFANWELGYGDFHLVPDMNTLRMVDWQERTAMVICDVKDDKTHSLTPEAPRSLLRSQIARAQERGFTALAASELEYYKRSHAWITTYAPFEDPQFVVTVLVEHGGHGSSGAAPLAKTMLEKYFFGTSEGLKVAEAEDSSRPAVLITENIGKENHYGLHTGVKL
jgi:hypothetical protein